MTSLGHVVLVGDTVVATRLVTLLRADGQRVVHLERPDVVSLVSHLAEADRVAVLLHDDVDVLRHALTVADTRPGLPLLVTVFDRTIADRLAAVPACTVASPSELVAPALTAACVAPWAEAVLAGETPPVQLVRREGRLVAEPFALGLGSRWRRRGGLLLGQLRPHDGGSRMLVLGASGLALLLLADTLLQVVVLHRSLVEGSFAAAAILATVDVREPAQIPEGYQGFATAAMLASVGFTAAFTAGFVERLVSHRFASLLGTRAVPRAGHVVVAGLGQVGIRLCVQMQALGHTVSAVERDPRARQLRLARQLRIPVVLGDACDRFVLQRLAVPRALAFVAAASDDLENLAMAIAVQSVAPHTRLVVRGDEFATRCVARSLIDVGKVHDVAQMAASELRRLLYRQPAPAGGPASHADPMSRSRHADSTL